MRSNTLGIRCLHTYFIDQSSQWVMWSIISCLYFLDISIYPIQVKLTWESIKFFKICLNQAMSPWPLLKDGGEDNWSPCIMPLPRICEDLTFILFPTSASTKRLLLLLPVLQSEQKQNARSMQRDYFYLFIHCKVNTNKMQDLCLGTTFTFKFITE